jgi:hypothetical protein
MPTNPLNSASASTPSTSTPSVGSVSTPAPLSESQISQRQFNKAILESQQSVSIGTKDQPQALLLKAAIEAINEQLAPYLGEDSLSVTLDNNTDVSPEATASRIVSQSTAFFGAFQNSNDTLGFEQQLEKFLQVIGGGIDQGFSEARDILDSLQVLEGDVASNINKTYDLVQAGLASFKEQQLLNA